MEENVTLIMYSDLLGFGNLVASANGTFSSPVGEIAFKRIEYLRKAAFQTEAQFPTSTTFYQLNDLMVACMDVDINVRAMTVSPESISVSPVPQWPVVTEVLKFLSASAKFHQQVIQSEETDNLGQGPRTFVVLGRRWRVSARPEGSRINDIFELQANMALAEAYHADSLGSGAGFNGGPWDRFYVNDFLWSILVGASAPLARHHAVIPNPELQRLDAFGVPHPGRTFPENLSRKAEIKVHLFHRERIFRSLMSHLACQI